MSSSSVFSPASVSARYWSILPWSEASAIVTWTPRISAGYVRGSGFGFAGAGAEWVACRFAPWPAAFASRSVRKRAPRVVPAAASATTARAAILRIARRLRACRRRLRNLSFGSTGSRSMNLGTLMECASCPQPLKGVDATLFVALGCGHAGRGRTQGGGAEQRLPFAAQAGRRARRQPRSGEPLAAWAGDRSGQRGAARCPRARHVGAPSSLRARDGREVALRLQSVPAPPAADRRHPPGEAGGALAAIRQEQADSYA